MKRKSRNESANPKYEVIHVTCEMIPQQDEKPIYVSVEMIPRDDKPIYVSVEMIPREEKPTYVSVEMIPVHLKKGA